MRLYKLYAHTQIDDLFYCPTHNCGATVTQITLEYYWYCRQCHRRRYYGASRLTAEVKATYHAIHHRHDVKVMQGDTVLLERNHHTEPTLFETDEPPY